MYFSASSLPQQASWRRCCGSRRPAKPLQCSKHAQRRTPTAQAAEQQKSPSVLSSKEVIPEVTRRGLLASALLLGAAEAPARAAVTVAKVSPPVAPAGALTARELTVIDIFERTAPAVVNVFDITIYGRTVQDDLAPEGNGTGFVWDKAGHIVTNYHVIGNVLNTLKPPPGGFKQPPRVARVSLLGRDGLQQSVDAYLVGADRARDLVVLSINVPPEQLVPVPLGSSRGLKVGQQLLAIGNPVSALPLQVPGMDSMTYVPVHDVRPPSMTLLPMK